MSDLSSHSEQLLSATGAATSSSALFFQQGQTSARSGVTQGLSADSLLAEGAVNVPVDQELQAYRHAVTQSSIVALTDTQGIVLEVNERFCQCSQYSRAELVGRPYPADQARFQAEGAAQELWQLISDGQSWQGELCNYAKNGSCYWLDMIISPVLDQKGRVVQYLFVGNDITQRKQAEASLQKQRQALESQLQRSRFVQTHLDGKNKILNLIATSAPLASTLAAIAELTESLSSDLLCAIMVADEQTGTLVHQAAPSLPQAFVEMMDHLPITPEGGACAAAAHHKQVVIVHDIAADTAAHYVNDVALDAGFKACWATPVLVREQVAAVLAIYYRQPQYPCSTHRALAKQALELIQVAVERHRSETSLRKKLQQTLLLSQITQDIRSSLKTQEVFKTAVRQVRKLFQADRVSLFCLDSASHSCGGHFLAEDVLPGYDSLLSQDIDPQHCCRVLQEIRPTYNPWVVEDIYYSGLDDACITNLEAIQVQAAMLVAIMVSNRPWGLLCIHQCSGPRQWQASEVEFAQELTAQLSIAIHQADLLAQATHKSSKLHQLLGVVHRQKEQETKMAERERAISRVIQQIRETLDMSTILETSAQEARGILQCDRVLIYRFSSDWKREIAWEAVDERWPALKGISGLTWMDHSLHMYQGGDYRNQESLTVSDIYQTDYGQKHIACLQQLGIRAFMVVPIFVGEQLWGLIGAYQNEETRDWNIRDINFLKRISNQLGVAFQQTELLAELKTAKEKADEANKAKSAFLASMSHELRTPLNAILGFSQLMQRDREITPSQKETLEIINRSGNHLLSLINDVLEMSKIEAGRLTLDESDLDFQGLCQSIYDMFRLKAEHKGIQLHLEYDSEIPKYIYSDERKLRQILLNLVGNSIKFTDHGSVTLKLWRGKSVRLNPMTSLSGAPVEIFFSIADTGPGISPHELAGLFNAFSQTESGRKSQEGSGLGLCISREFVRLMGGKLTLESELNKGTEVKFSLQVPPVSGKQIKAPVDQRVIGLAPGQRQYRLLIVEDRLENKMLLQKLLTCVGFDVRTAMDGEAAIAQWRDWKPDLIWMDLQMPVMDGFTATRIIREAELEERLQQRGPGVSEQPLFSGQALSSGQPVSEELLPEAERQTFILALTASAFEETRTITLEAGFDDFIRKPFKEEIIFEKMAQYLNIQYCYEPIDKKNILNDKSIFETQGSSSSNHGINQVLMQQIDSMGEAWRSSLYEASDSLDEVRIHELLRKIEPKFKLLSEHLWECCYALRFDQIGELIQCFELGSYTEEFKVEGVP